MTLEEIKQACDDIACNPNEKHEVSKLSALVKAASKINYTLEFHVGHNLLQEPYIQGYNLELYVDQIEKKKYNSGTQ